VPRRGPVAPAGGPLGRRVARGAALGTSTLSGWGIGGERLVRRLTDRSRRGAAPHGRPSWRTTGSGPLLVLLGGYTASGHVWPDHWLRRLEAQYEVLRVASHRRATPARPRPLTIGDMADEVAAVLDACGHARATVLGLSMGGMVAQELGLRHADRAEHLVLVATIPPPRRRTCPQSTTGRCSTPHGAVAVRPRTIPGSAS
jgi:pimeloyl-ACP methyl ester carboxylesterase